MEGFGYGWEYFNHRVGALDIGVDEAGAFAAVIGGTSTTGETPSLEATCDPDLCEEFPFLDNATVWADRATASTSAMTASKGTAQFTTGVEGADTTVAVVMEADDSATAILTGLNFDTAGDLLGCYDPTFGWHPKQLVVTLGAPRLNAEGVSVDVSATFAPGPSEEDVRACIDAVYGDAVVSVRVDFLVVSGAETEPLSIHSEATYPFAGDAMNPETQEDAALEPLGVDATTSLLGLTSIAWTFHEAEARGAYLRTLGVEVGPLGGRGLATNYSPATQLSAFDFQFDGTVVVVDLGVDVQRTRWTGKFAAELSPDRSPVVHRLAAP